MKERSFFTQNLLTPLIFAVVIFIYFILKKGFTIEVIVEALLTAIIFTLFYIFFGRMFRRLRSKRPNEERDDDGRK